MLLDLVDYAFGIRVGTSLEEGNRHYESVVRKRAMADGGRFPLLVTVIHGLLRPVAVAIILIGILDFMPVKHLNWKFCWFSVRVALNKCGILVHRVMDASRSG
jgi:hypothetical protein